MCTAPSPRHGSSFEVLSPQQAPLGTHAGWAGGRCCSPRFLSLAEPGGRARPGERGRDRGRAPGRQQGVRLGDQQGPSKNNSSYLR